jgi:hypothetical protein
LLTRLAQTAGRFNFGRANLRCGPWRLDTPRRNPIAPTRPSTCAATGLRSRRVVPARPLAIFGSNGSWVTSRSSRPVVAGRRTFARLAVPSRPLARIRVAAWRATTGVAGRSWRATTGGTIAAWRAIGRFAVSPRPIIGLTVRTRSRRRRPWAGAARRRCAVCASSTCTLAGALTRSRSPWSLWTAGVGSGSAVVRHRSSSLGPKRERTPR